MPRIQNRNPLPNFCYCPYCGHSIVTSWIGWEEYVNVRRWGTALIGENGWIDNDITDEDTVDNMDETYRCGECDFEITQEVTNSHRMINEINNKISEINSRLPENQLHPNLVITKTDDGVRHFTAIAYKIALKLLEEENETIAPFNTQHVVYRDFVTAEDQEETAEDQEETEEDSEVDPFDNHIIEIGHHRRWNNHINYRQKNHTCEHCKFMFLIEDPEDIICPACKKECQSQQTNREELIRENIRLTFN